MEFGKGYWRTFEQGIQREWLLTNGIGGFASSTLIEANTRRYHGLLVASLRPPVQRHLLVSKLDESITLGEETFSLHSFQASDGFIMKGYHHLQRVRIDSLPLFVYSVRDVFIEKRIAMEYGKNKTVLVYRIKNGSRKANFKISPLLNFRDYHFNSSRGYLSFVQKREGNETVVTPTFYDLDIRLYCSEGYYSELQDCYFNNMHYPVEQERGLHASEDHYIPGFFEIPLEPWEEKTITFIAAAGKELGCTDGPLLLSKEEERMQGLIEKAGYEDTLANTLVIAADSFIVKRESTDAKTVIAGYPWFTDWGRDTMIAFTGITLATRRFDDARDILKTFARYVKDGLVPNMFPDGDQSPLYNTVDAALWFFEAASKYLEYTGDDTFIRKFVYQPLKQIAEAYTKGTHFCIRMDEDSLVTAGESGTQLTWMDAKIGDWVVTPRHGKAVEINALWYNALCIMKQLADRFGDDGSFYEETRKSVKQKFLQTFWNEKEQCLYDVVQGDFRDGRVRPNQILAVSLTHPVTEGEAARKIVEKVWKELYTAYGLRSLSPYAAEYCGIYTGDQHRRDSAYHQGTVWTWPLGHFISAYSRTLGAGNGNKEKVLRFIAPFADHLQDACVGSISEIFDGDEPHVPRGCFAQAWSVGEILRVYAEEVLHKG
jgi:predicted glycogen debranching enzyme